LTGDALGWQVGSLTLTDLQQATELASSTIVIGILSGVSRTFSSEIPHFQLFKTKPFHFCKDISCDHHQTSSWTLLIVTYDMLQKIAKVFLLLQILHELSTRYSCLFSQSLSYGGKTALAKVESALCFF